MVRAQVPEARAALGRRSARRNRAAASPGGAGKTGGRTIVRAEPSRTLSRGIRPAGGHAVQEPIRRRPPERVANVRIAKGPEVTDRPTESAATSSASGAQITTLGRRRLPARHSTVRSDLSPPPRAQSDERERGDPPSPRIRARRCPLGSRRAYRRRPLPAAGVPRRRASPAVLAGAGHRAGPASGADLRRPGRGPARRRPAGDLGAHLRLSRIEKPGIARVLDVVHTGSGGLVVAEWIRGGSLQEVADTAPSPVGAMRAMQSLAAAADAAHRAGVALSIDHPSRVRVSIDGDVVLAYPATMPDANPQDDIRGIGAALYALLVNRWPLAESGVRSGLAPAERDSAGQPRRTHCHRPRHPLPDFRGRCPLGPGGRWNTQCVNAFEPAATSDRGGRPHRGARPDRRLAAARDGQHAHPSVETTACSAAGAAAC